MGDDALRDRIRTFADRELSLAEARGYLETPLTPEERAEILDLVRWFTTRYPTPCDRLAYVRRAYARWTDSAAAPSTSSLIPDP